MLAGIATQQGQTLSSGSERCYSVLETVPPHTIVPSNSSRVRDTGSVRAANDAALLVSFMSAIISLCSKRLQQQYITSVTPASAPLEDAT